jgi:hypothetical protein
MSKHDDYVGYIKGLPKDEQEGEIDSKISETMAGLLDAEAVSSEMASSNADGWGIDVFEVLGIDLSRPDEIRAKVSFTLSGNQKDDQQFCGTSIEGETVAIIDASGHVRYTEVTAERDLGGDDDEPD